MEFLALISPIIAYASKALALAWYQKSKRKEALDQINQKHEDLARAVVNEGRKIESYIEFDNLIAQIDGALAVILESNKMTVKDNTFWKNIKVTHQQLQYAVSIKLFNFNVTHFDPYHQGLVSALRPILGGQIQQANALFDVHKRKEYVRHLLQTLPQVGQMKGFASLIIEGVTKSLVAFR